MPKPPTCALHPHVILRCLACAGRKGGKVRTAKKAWHARQNIRLARLAKKLVLLVSVLLAAGCAAKPQPLGCLMSEFREKGMTPEQTRQYFWDVCGYSKSGAGYPVSHSEVWPFRLRYVGPSYRGGQGGLEPY